MTVKKDIIKIAKEVVAQTGTHGIKFFIEIPDGRLAHVDVSEVVHDKDKMLEGVKEIVEKTGATRYYSVADTRILDQSEVTRHAKKALEEYGGDPVDMLSHLALLTQNKQENPASFSALVLMTFDKTSGTDMEIHKYVADPKKRTVKFMPKRSPKTPFLSTPYNIWNPHQIDLR